MASPGKMLILPIGQPNPTEAHDVTEEKGQYSDVGYNDHDSDTGRGRCRHPLPLVGFHCNVCSYIYGLVAGDGLIAQASSPKKHDHPRPERDGPTIDRGNLKIGAELEFEQPQRR